MLGWTERRGGGLQLLAKEEGREGGDAGGEKGGGHAAGRVAAAPAASPVKHSQAAWGQTLPAASPGGKRKGRESPRPPASSNSAPNDAVKQGCGSLLKLLLEGLITYLKKK